MKKITKIAIFGDDEAAHKEYMPPWNHWVTVGVIASPVFVAIVSVLTVMYPHIDFGGALPAGFIVLALSLFLYQIYNVPIHLFRRHMKHTQSEREESKLWFKELRILRYMAAVQINALADEFNDHLDRLKHNQAKPGEREQVARDAIAELTRSFRDTSKAIDIELRAEGRKRADVHGAFESLEQLQQAAGEVQTGTLSSQVVADLETETVAWQEHSPTPVSFPEKKLQRARQAMAGLRQGPSR